jgi:hypothetical protein
VGVLHGRTFEHCCTQMLVQKLGHHVHGRGVGKLKELNVITAMFKLTAVNLYAKQCVLVYLVCKFCPTVSLS